MSLPCRVPEHCDSGAVREMDCSRGVAALHPRPPCTELPGAVQVSHAHSVPLLIAGRERHAEATRDSCQGAAVIQARHQNRCILHCSASELSAPRRIRQPCQGHEKQLVASAYSAVDIKVSVWMDYRACLSVYRWPVVAEVSRKVLGWRLKALPYLYSAFYDSHAFGCPIARPLWFNFPSNPATLRLQEQWMMGGPSHLLMCSRSVIVADCAHPPHVKP